MPTVAPDPNALPSLLELVRRTTQQLRTHAVLYATCVMFAWLCGSSLLAIVCDWFVPLAGPWIRLPCLFFVLIPTCVLFIRVVWCYTQSWQPTEVARRIEAHVPGMNQRLVSCLDLLNKQATISPAFFGKLLTETLARVHHFQPRSIVNHAKLRRSQIIAASAAMALVVAVFLGGPASTKALERIARPFADIPPHGSLIQIEPGTTSILRGEAVTFRAQASTEFASGLRVELYGIQKTLYYDMEPVSRGEWQRVLQGLHAEPGFEVGFEYRIFGGGTWSPLQSIRWIDRPSIDAMTIRIHHPEYMGIPEPRINPPKDRDIVGPIGSTVEVQVTTQGDVAHASLDLLGEMPATFAMEQRGTQWQTTFPLAHDGQYRVAVRNEHGHASPSWRELPKVQLLPDLPPTILLEQTTTNIVLSKPERLPLLISVRDDFGVRAVRLSVQRDKQNYQPWQTLKEYPTPNPPRIDRFAGALDLTAMGLNIAPGEQLRYRVEVCDWRPYSPWVSSLEGVVRLVPEDHSADKQRQAFENSQEHVRLLMGKLLAEQAAVQTKITQVQVRFAELRQRLRNDPATPLSTRESQELLRFRQEFNQLHEMQVKNNTAAQHLEDQLRDFAQRAMQTTLVNKFIAQEWEKLASQFKPQALDPMLALSNTLKHGTDLKNTPDTPEAKRQSDHVQRQLEVIQQHMNALAKAHQALSNDPAAALEQFKHDMQAQQGKLSANELAELKEFLKNLREQLAQRQHQQEGLATQTQQATPNDVPRFAEEQKKLNPFVKQDLDAAKKILERELNAAKKDAPEVSPKVNEPDTNPSQKKETPSKPDVFLPALGGGKPTPDPRFQPKSKANTPDAKPTPYDQLREQQRENLEKLDAAQKALQSDEQSLEQMIQQIMSAVQPSTQQGNPMNPPKGKSGTNDLANLLQSEAMKNARAMNQRAKQDKMGQGNPATQPPTGTATTSDGGNAMGLPGSFEELDPRTRATLLQLPPKVREELLQGLKQQGPMGYESFIHDYFRRLAETRPTNNP